MADAGYIPREAVRCHVKRNVLTNFLGGHNGKVKTDLRWLRLADGDRLLLCGDGLSEMVDDLSIERIFAQHDDPRAGVQHLLEEALDREGKDNVTIIVARYDVSGGAPAGVDPPGATIGAPLETTSDSTPPPSGVVAG